MAPLPPSNTKRFELAYETCGFAHTLQMRTVTDMLPSEASTALDGFLTAIASQIYQLTVVQFSVIDKEDTISFPVTWSGDPSYGTGEGPADHTAAYVDFVGRSAGGRRCRVAVFGGKNYSVGADFRVTSSDSTVVADALAALVGAEGAFLAIDESQVLWHAYFNIGANAYWRNKIR